MIQRALLIGLLLGGLFAVPVATQQDPQITIAINNLITGVTSFTRERLIASGYINWGSGTDAAGYGLRASAGEIQVKNSGGTWTTIVGSGGNPVGAPYWTRTTDPSLTNETALSTLATALLLNTTATGVPTAYAGTSCMNQFVYAVSAIGVASCDSVVLSTDVAGTLALANGGLGLTTGTSGGVLAFTAAGTLASSGALAANRIVLGGGAGAVPTILGSLGTTTTILHGNAAGAPTFAAVTLTTDVAGILPTANGGTNNAFIAWSGPATSTKTYTLPNATSTILTSNAAVTPAQGGTGLSSYTTGMILHATAGTTLAGLADVATGNALLSGGVGVVPAYGKVGLTTHVSGTLPVTNGGTGLASYTTGDIPYASSGTSLAGRAAVAVGQVLISAGVATAPVWSATPTMTSLSLLGTLTLSGTAPTISSGFGTTPSVTVGTAAAFRVDVGTGGAASAGVIGLPTAANGWNCDVEDITATTANAADRRTVQLSSTTTTATVEQQTISTGGALAWTASDILAVSCTAF
jgi:hypothetical protein